MRTRIFTDERCLEHLVPPGFPERPERLGVLLEGVREAGVSVEGGARHARAEALIAEVHDGRYLDRLRKIAEEGNGFLDTGDNPVSAGTWRAAKAAVEACLQAADWVIEKPGRTAFAAVRPPGHHAERAQAMGFCFLNNVAIAAEHFLRSAGAERVAIVDFDVHHGNGTQHLFEERPEVLYASIHQYPFYPGTGSAGERGRGRGEGFTVNVPLAAGSGDEQYAEAFRLEVLPSLGRFAPDILLISAGFDAWRADPIGGMRVSAEAFRDWGGWLGEAADKSCQGRVFLVLEGGYDVQVLPGLLLAHLRGLEGSHPEPAS